MPEPAIIDTTVITVKSTTKDTYGNMIVTPTVGDDFRVGVKRESLFELFQENRAVKLYWAEYQHKKYVAKAELFDGTPPIEKQIEPITAGVKSTTKPPTRSEEIEEMVWWKLLGDAIFTKDIDVTKPEGKLIRDAFYVKMLSVLDIKIKKEVK